MHIFTGYVRCNCDCSCGYHREASYFLAPFRRNFLKRNCTKGVKVKRLLLVVVGLMSFLIIGCGESEPQKVTFMAGFKPQANLPFVAAYVAQEKGYFSDEGLEVEILHSAGGGENMTLLLAGKVDFTTADANSVLKYRASQQAPVKAIALFGQRGQQAFISLTESGIKGPEDWSGKRFGYKISIPPDYLAIAESVGLDRDSVEEIQVGFDPRILLQDKVDILAVFKSNEPNIIRSMGHEVEVFEAADYGVPTLGLTYIATEETIDLKSQVTKDFIKATMRATEFIENNQDATLDIVMKYAENENRDHMRFMLETELSDSMSAATMAGGIGAMNSSRWNELRDVLLKFGAIEKSVNIEDAVDDSLRSSLFKDGKLK
ncbi:MAG: ABC transporter substrate-binding protein [SAR202 cluster bacterium]|nr:ABC transporter substrate-binding protein [SAR202 cluster bacterium]